MGVDQRELVLSIGGGATRDSIGREEATNVSIGRGGATSIGGHSSRSVIGVS